MHFFEYPYVIITILVLGFLLLGAVGIYFAVRGVKTANGKEERDFTNVSGVESRFAKSKKLRGDRCIVYISVFLGNFRNLATAAQCEKVLEEIKSILLTAFWNVDGGAIAACGENNYVAFAEWDADTTRANVETCREEIGKCLQNNNALNLVDVRFGVFFAVGSLLTFDEAMGRAKQACMVAQNEKIAYAEWDINSGKALEKKIKIENNIEREIDNNRFFLKYQPVLDAKTKKIIGAEVLSRLNSESEGLLSPVNFLSAVDSVGLNEKFDYYIFEKNCKWISNDKKMREGYTYTINFSRSTLCDPAFAQKITEIADKYDLKSSCLAVEILEDKNVTGDAKDRMVKNLSTLKEKGFSILLDDFGSGFTSFGDLQNLDVSIVKIDRSITQNATTETGFVILKNIIRTAKDIGFETLCEGVETEEQEKAAIEAGCDLLQGFYYYKPMSVAQLEKLFDDSTEA